MPRQVERLADPMECCGKKFWTWDGWANHQWKKHRVYKGRKLDLPTTAYPSEGKEQR